MKRLMVPWYRCWLELLLLLLWLPSMASADALLPGERGLSGGYCVMVRNLADFPDYAILWQILGNSVGSQQRNGVVPVVARQRGPDAAGPQELHPGECVKVATFRDSFFTLLAVRKQDLVAGVPPDPAKLIPSDLKLRSIRTVKEAWSVEAIADIWQIQALTPAGLQVVKTHVRYTHTDGSTEEVAYGSTGMLPPPTHTRPAWLRPLVATTVPLAALVLIGVLVLRRRQQRA